MARPRKPKTTPREDVGIFPSNFPVPVHTGDYWQFNQRIINKDGIIGWDAPTHEPHSNEARAQQIRELPAAELEAFCTPGELTTQKNIRWYFGQMNQAELEKQAGYDPDAAVELLRRNGELPR